MPILYVYLFNIHKQMVSTTIRYLLLQYRYRCHV